MPVKKVIICGMLLCLWIPFILITDIYPFFRFGMFAEPVKQAVQLEQFAIRYEDTQGSLHLVSPLQLGIGSLPYLMRNYYYRNESAELLKHLHTIYTAKQPKAISQWQLLRITSPLSQFRPDTTVVATYPVL